MPPFLAIFYRSCRLHLPATIALLISFILPWPATAQPLIHLGRDADGRQLFKIGALTAAMSPGDRLGSCTVTETGLDCPPGADPTAGNDSSCSEQLRRQQQIYRQRYLQSLDEYSKNLRRKNYELVEKSRQLQELRDRLAKTAETDPMQDNRQSGDGQETPEQIVTGKKSTHPTQN